MANIFQKTPVPNAHHSNHNLSHVWSGSIDMGYLIPIDWQIMNPNETFKGNTEAYIQFAPLTYPVMHRINCKIYHFFVPFRILWKYWQKFYCEAADDEVAEKYPMISVDFSQLGTFEELKPGTLSDYLGIPVRRFFNHVGSISEEVLKERITVLPYLAYQKIWNDYFRDEHLSIDIFDEDEDNIPATENLYYSAYSHKGLLSLRGLRPLFQLRKKAWEKDYFTSATPEPQQGPGQNVPVSSNNAVIENLLAPVVSNTVANYPDGVLNVGLPKPFYNNDNVSLLSPLSIFEDKISDNNITRTQAASGSVGRGVYAQLDNVPVNIQGLTFSLNDLRLASAIQRYEEALMRGGNRYKEAVISFYNQVVPDYRLDRPEFIASSTIPVVVGEVPQTSETSQSSPQGQLAGRASVYGSNNNFKYHSDEHGIFMTLAVVLPRSQYCDGIPRKFSILDRFDLHNPYFENLGDQAIANKEVYFSPEITNPNDAFGYAPRYSEYKFSPSTIHGDFLSSLDFMTLTRFMNNQPHLNEDFITVDDETSNRAFAVQTDVQHLYCTFYNKLLARRAMQSNPIPRLI